MSPDFGNQKNERGMRENRVKAFMIARAVCTSYTRDPHAMPKHVRSAWKLRGVDSGLGLGLHSNDLGSKWLGVDLGLKSAAWKSECPHMAKSAVRCC